MHPQSRRLCALLTGILLASSAPVHAGPGQILPVQSFLSGRALPAPVSNAAFIPGKDALAAPPFTGVLHIGAAPMKLDPPLAKPVYMGRDTRIFPGVTLEFFTLGDLLVPVQRGQLVSQTAPGATPSYWDVIPEFGRVWREKADGGWSRAAFPIMLVNDTENACHEGLASFLYRDGKITGVRFQFVQQTAPWNLPHLFDTWGFAPARLSPGDAAKLADRRREAQAELAARLPAKPWADLVKSVPPGTLDHFGGPLARQWRVSVALVRNGVLYYQPSMTAYGPYPYPLEMRFGAHSVTKSIVAPLALLRLAKLYGPWVLTLKIGDYVPGINPKYRQVRFIDAADMAAGMGYVRQTLQTNPNMGETHGEKPGYLPSPYALWYNATSFADKIRALNETERPYPWAPGTVFRYRDQTFWQLGAAIQGFLKSIDGPKADLLNFDLHQVLQPIGIDRMPAIRTKEPDGSLGLVHAQAGYYPNLDDLAKIALFYEAGGEHNGVQILDRQLTLDWLAARNALVKRGDASLGPDSVPQDLKAGGLYLMGLHFHPYVSASGAQLYIPYFSGYGNNIVVLSPNHIIGIIIGKEANGYLPKGAKLMTDEGDITMHDIERLAPLPNEGHHRVYGKPNQPTF